MTERDEYAPSPDLIRANYLEWINWANPDQAAIDFDRMIEAVRQEERERCAQIAESHEKHTIHPWVPRAIARRIRQGGEQDQ